MYYAVFTAEKGIVTKKDAQKIKVYHPGIGCHYATREASNLDRLKKEVDAIMPKLSKAYHVHYMTDAEYWKFVEEKFNNQ